MYKTKSFDETPFPAFPSIVILIVFGLANNKHFVVNTDSTTSDGTHLVYSFFNNVEGLNIFRMVLEANGYARFKIGLDNGIWKIDMEEADLQKPCYILYSGNEKQMRKNIFV